MTIPASHAARRSLRYQRRFRSPESRRAARTRLDGKQRSRDGWRIEQAAETPRSRRLSSWAYAAVIVGCFAVGYWVVEDFFRRLGEHYPYAAFALAVGPAAVAVGGYYALEQLRYWRLDRGARRQSPGWTRPKETPRPSAILAAPFVILTVFALLGAQSGNNAHHGYISSYCQYGSVSESQLEHCMTHVGTDYINGLDTQAARFAREENNDCLEDSGPFCERAASWKSYTPDNPYAP